MHIETLTLSDTGFVTILADTPGSQIILNVELQFDITKLLFDLFEHLPIFI